MVSFHGFPKPITYHLNDCKLAWVLFEVLMVIRLRGIHESKASFLLANIPLIEVIAANWLLDSSGAAHTCSTCQIRTR